MLFPEDRMNVHKNARLTPHGRERIVRLIENGQTLKAVGKAAGICPRTVRKWVERYRQEGKIRWTDYRGKDHPNQIRIEHHKTGKMVLYPLEEMTDDRLLLFYEES
jgi:transposase